MQLNDLLGLPGGLALFLYGMQMMSDGLEDAAGNKMKTILERITSNRFMGVAVGAAITAVIQSSSATTVMVVGFVNSGMLDLYQAVWLIMGANIGTTITGQLISLKVSTLAPLFAFFGVSLLIFFNKDKFKHIGKILAGLGILFIGMNMMGDAMKPLRSSEEFIAIMTTFRNPVFGIMAGALFTAIIQSSSASIGILQTLASGGLIGFQSSVYVLFGQNIGTCITAVLASVGTNKNAKRATLLHLLFNITGTALFTFLCITTPLADIVAGFTPDNPSAQIANMHTFFNIATTVILLPFGKMLARLTCRILPQGEEEKADMFSEIPLGRTHLGSTAIHTDTLEQEVGRIILLAKENVSRCFEAVLTGEAAIFEQADIAEEEIDNLNKDICLYISKTLSSSGGIHNVTGIEEYFSITGNAERIADHAHNIGGYVKTILRKDITFSDEARREIMKMKEISLNAMEEILSRSKENMNLWLRKMEESEQNFDDITEKYKESHLERMRKGLCTEEGAILYSELITDFERIGDHVLNIAESYAKISLLEG